MKTNLENFDEVKLTAYALGELDAAGCSEVETFLATNADARRWVEDVRRTAEQLQAELGHEECPALTAEQSRAIAKKIGDEKRAANGPGFWSRQWLPRFGFIQALAVLAIVAVLAAMLLPSLAKSKNRSVKAMAASKQRQVEMQKQMAAEVQNESVSLAKSTADQPRTEPASQLGTPVEATAASSPPPASPAPMLPSADLFAVNSAVIPSGTAARKKLPSLQYGIGQVTRSGGSGAGGKAGVADESGMVFYRSRVDSLESKKDDDWFFDGKKDPQPLAKEKLSRRLQMPGQQSIAAFNTESYAAINDNPFLAAQENPLSTFSIDVDTASYANVRRFLTDNQMPPADAVRIEELVNYFSYDYPQPKGDVPFSVNAEVAGCPWNAQHRLVRVGLKGREIARDKRPASNLVFLIDVSGSMNEPSKLPLLKESLKLLARQLNENDHVSIVVYAGAAGTVLPETSGRDKAAILRALENLSAGGSTHGSAGIQLAYETATENFIKGGVNRVILCTDGDFNVGVTSQGELTRLITEKAKSGVFLSVLGFGMGNYKDSTMEMLADKGNGNYAYIDSLNEGRKVLVEQMSGTLVTIAKDVKIQIEFNPAQVNSYRLIGYENRLLAKEDFNNDKKDAGEIGAGHTVTAFYEVVPAGMTSDETPAVDALKYQKPAKPAVSSGSGELLTLKLRYKQPDGDTSRLLSTPVKDSDKSYERASADFKFAAAVAEFGMLLRDSPYKGDANFNSAWENTKANLGSDPEGYRAEFLTLVETAQKLAGK